MTSFKSSELQSAVDFASKLPTYNIVSKQSTDDTLKNTNPSESVLKLSGFMNIAMNISRVRLDRSTNLTMEGCSYIDEWIVLKSNPAFSTQGNPTKDWRRDVKVHFGKSNGKKMQLEVGYVPPTDNIYGEKTSVQSAKECYESADSGKSANIITLDSDVKCLDCYAGSNRPSSEFIITEDSVHLTKYSGMLDFQPLFCLCHLPEDDEEEVDVLVNEGGVDISRIDKEFEQASPTFRVNSSSNDVLSSASVISVPQTQTQKSIYAIDKDRGQYVECCIGLAGCNGWMHSRCVGLGHLTEAEICLLDDVVCPLCVWYLQGTGDDSQLQNKL